MRGVDLNTFRFNYDLTMAVILMHPNGTVYARYAGRDFRDASSHQSTTSLARVLDDVRQTHRRDLPAPERKPAITVEQLPHWSNHRKAQAAKCFHCHQVHDAYQREGILRNRWSKRDQFNWPDTSQVGLRFDREKQVVVAEAEDSTGLRRGDRIVSINGIPAIAYGDIKFALNEAPWDANKLRIRYVRGSSRTQSTTIALKSGWKIPTPEVYAWRPMKWAMSPKPGFGGRPLTAEQKRALKLPEKDWAFRVGYLVTWGPSANTGRAAAKAGIRKGTIVYAVDGKSDFKGMDHFHAWFRMTRALGVPVKVSVIQNGTRKTVELTPVG